MKFQLKIPIRAGMWTLLYLLGWCFASNIPSFFSHSARAVIFIVTFVWLCLYRLLTWKFGVEPKRRGARGNAQQDIVLPLCLLIWALIPVLSGYSDAAGWIKLPDIETLRTAGVILFLLSVVLIIFGPLALGRCYSDFVTVPDGRKPVTNGIYAVIRHPQYLGLMLWGLSISLVFQSLIGLLLAALCLALLLWRISAEEALMSEAFGSEWEEYAKKVKRLIPFVY